LLSQSAKARGIESAGLRAAARDAFAFTPRCDTIRSPLVSLFRVPLPLLPPVPDFEWRARSPLFGPALESGEKPNGNRQVDSAASAAAAVSPPDELSIAQYLLHHCVELSFPGVSRKSHQPHTISSNSSPSFLRDTIVSARPVRSCLFLENRSQLPPPSARQVSPCSLREPLTLCVYALSLPLTLRYHDDENGQNRGRLYALSLGRL